MTCCTYLDRIESSFPLMTMRRKLRRGGSRSRCRTERFRCRCRRCAGIRCCHRHGAICSDPNPHPDPYPDPDGTPDPTLT